MISIQGAKMERPSRISISLAAAEDSIQRVKVGGEAVLAGLLEGPSWALLRGRPSNNLIP
jgi:predicted PhzF superfamily epimerase YddE/YHI9